MKSEEADYLRPYLQAMKRHGTEFPSLLWASRETQKLRFEALTRLCDLSGINVCDAGCGQADFLDYLIAREVRPAHYVGIEALDEHIDLARKKGHGDCLIVRGDFVREPQRLLVGADVIVFCGSLNTLSESECHAAVKHGYEAAGDAVVLNFLSSPRLASADWLTWHEPRDMEAFLRGLGGAVSVLDGYLEGDCSAIVRKRA